MTSSWLKVSFIIAMLKAAYWFLANMFSVREQHLLDCWQVHCLSKKVSKLSIASSITEREITVLRRPKTRLGSASLEMLRQMAEWKKEYDCCWVVPTMGS